MRHSALRALLTAFLVAIAAPAAVAGTISAELDRAAGTLGESFLLTVSIAGSRDSDLEVPDVAGLVLRRQGVSQQTTIVNGRIQMEVHVTFAIYPQQAGEFTIPSLTIQLDGQKESSLPLTLRVDATGTAQGGAAGQGSGAAGQGSGSASGTAAAAQAAADTGGVFLERECTTASPLVGQQIPCVVRIYHRGNLNGGQRLNQSSADFRRFNVDGEKRYQKIVSGQRYAVIELKEIVVPTRAGALDLPPYALDAHVLVANRRGNPFEKFLDRFGGGGFNFDMGFTEEKQITVQTAPTPFEVRALPDAGKPAAFNGLVGDFKLSVSVSKSSIAAGETVTITITIVGDGILDQVDQLPLSLEQIGRVYPDKPEYTEQVSGDSGIHSSKTFKFALVPSKAGKYELGDVNLPIYNPKLEQYVTLNAPLGPLIVDPGKAEEKPLVVGSQGPDVPNRSDVKVLAQDLLGPHAPALLDRNDELTPGALGALAGSGAGSMLLSLALVGAGRLRRRRGASPERERRSKALTTYREQKGKTPTEAYRAFRSYLGDKLGLAGAALTSRDVLDQLGKLGLAEDGLRRAKSLVERFDQAEFSGTFGGNADALGRELDELVQEIEKR